MKSFYLLCEEIYNNLAIVYHRTGKRDPNTPVLIGQQGWKKSSGIMGTGIYTTYNLKESDNYFQHGPYLIKSKTNLHGYLILVEEIAERIYGKDSSIEAQLHKLLGNTSNVLRSLNKFADLPLALKHYNSNRDSDYDEWPAVISLLKHLQLDKDPQGRVKGVVFSEMQYQDNLLAYDEKSLIPVAFAHAPDGSANIKWEPYSNIRSHMRRAWS